MKMLTRVHNDMRELTQFVNANDIAKEQIVDIQPRSDGTYLLVYYAE